MQKKNTKMALEYFKMKLEIMPHGKNFFKNYFIPYPAPPSYGLTSHIKKDLI